MHKSYERWEHNHCFLLYHNERTQKNITDTKGWGTVYARMMGLGYLYQTLEPLIYRVWCYPDNYEVSCLSYKSNRIGILILLVFILCIDWNGKRYVKKRMEAQRWQAFHYLPDVYRPHYSITQPLPRVTNSPPLLTSWQHLWVLIFTLCAVAL